MTSSFLIHGGGDGGWCWRWEAHLALMVRQVHEGVPDLEGVLEAVQSHLLNPDPQVSLHVLHHLYRLPLGPGSQVFQTDGERCVCVSAHGCVWVCVCVCMLV